MSKKSRRRRKRQLRQVKSQTKAIQTTAVGLVIFHEDHAPEVIPQCSIAEELAGSKNSSEFIRCLFRKSPWQDVTLFRRMTGFCVQFTDQGRIITREIVYGIAYEIEQAAGNGFSYLRLGHEDGI